MTRDSEKQSLTSMSDSDWDLVAATQSPVGFARWATTKLPGVSKSLEYKTPPHIRLLNRKLVKLANGELEGLVICMPPRHGKSELCSKYLPAWFLSKYPDKRVLMTSAESTLAADFGGRARRLVEQVGPPVFGVAVDPRNSASDHWRMLNREGGMDTAGVGGSLTGRGAHLFIADDLIKNHEQALSETWRRKTWELWMSVIETRAEPGCGFVLINTRWHEDDVAGHVLEEIDRGVRPGWESVILPALAEEDDPLGRKPGEALWPERFSTEKLLEKKGRWDSDEARLGPFWWQALYQGSPRPREGGTFQKDWFRYFELDESGGEEIFKLDRGADVAAASRHKIFRRRDCYCVASCDPALSEKETSDFTSIGLWYVTPDADLLLHSVIRGRMPAHAQVRQMHVISREFSPIFIGVESFAFQLALVQDAVRMGLPARESRLPGDKVAKAQLAATRFMSGSIFLRSGAPWLTDYEDELLFFPNGRHDDQVDMTSIAVNELSSCIIPQVY